MRCFRFDSLRATSIFRLTPTSLRQQVATLRSFGHSQLRHSSRNTDTEISTDNLRLLNKSLYDASLKCHRLGWYARRNRLPSRSDGLSKNDPMKDFLIRQGIWFERYVYAHKYGYEYQYYHPSQYNCDTSNNDDDECNGEISSQPQNPQQQPSNLAIVHEGSPTEAAKATTILMAQGNHTSDDGSERSIDIILQPTFLCGNLVARADVAVRSMAKVKEDGDGDGDNYDANANNEDENGNDDNGDDDDNGDGDGESWEILEIKSSTEKSFRKKIPDLAFTVCVARAAGYNVSRASLVVVDPTYVRKNNNRTAAANANDADANAASNDEDENDENLLYKTIDCTELVDNHILKNKMDKRVTDMDAITGGGGGDDNKRSVPPPVKYKLTCGKCELLGVECGPISSIDKSSNDDDNDNGNNDTDNDNENGNNDNNNEDDRKRSTPFLPLKHGIWELPRLTQKHFPDVLKRALPTLEIQDMDLILPGDESSFLPLLTKNQMRFFHAVVTNAVVVEYSELEKCLEGIANNNNNSNGGDGNPVAMYLDFEAVSILNPPHTGMAPYESMVTQYSLHRHEFNNGDNGLSHSEYLSDPQRDCRKALLEHLLDDLGYKDSRSGDKKNDCGSEPILVYSSYEKTQLNKLAKIFPEHSDAISDVIEHRLVDLEKIIKDCVSHPGFCGRSSIKKTLPALVPGFEKAYQDLLENSNTTDADGGCGDEQQQQHGIAEGGAASAAYADLMSGVYGEAVEIERTKTALLEYCKLDTLALVEIHKALWKLIDDRPPVSKGKATRQSD